MTWWAFFVVAYLHHKVTGGAIMSKKEKKKNHKKQNNENNLYDDLPDGLLDSLDKTNIYLVLYITLAALVIITLFSFLVLLKQYTMLAEIMEIYSQTTAVHIPTTADLESYSGTIKTW